MKIHCLILLALVYAGPDISGDIIGESCYKKATFKVTAFSISPYPISLNQNYTITMTGVFEKAELLDQLTIGLKRSFDDWQYSFNTLNEYYLKGETATFSFSNPWPTEKGRYTDQITLHRPNYTMFACWQYTYKITS